MTKKRISLLATLQIPTHIYFSKEWWPKLSLNFLWICEGFHSFRNTYGQFWRDILFSIFSKKIKHNLKSWNVAKKIRISCLHAAESGYDHEKFWSRLLTQCWRWILSSTVLHSANIKNKIKKFEWKPKFVYSALLLYKNNKSSNKIIFEETSRKTIWPWGRTIEI